MSGDFVLFKWAEDNELSTETREALAQKGFASKKTISKLSSDLIRQEFKKLPLAQSLLLQDACMVLQKSTTSGGATIADGVQVGEPIHTTQGNGGTALGSMTAHDVANFLGQGGSVLSDNFVECGKPQLFDPLQFDTNYPSAKCPYRDIRDFISLVPKGSTTSSDSGSIQIGSQQFLLKDSKIPWEVLTISQYMEGGLKILREMALNDGASKGELLEYANYLVKISTLAQCFHWQSVLKYDQAYRKAQAQSGFHWGADNAYMMQLYLKSEPMNKSTQPKRPQSSSGKKNKVDPDSGTPICMKWNGSNGCNFRGCKFAHICMKCYSTAHPECQHNLQPSEKENA
jgi:hypothetical protein